MGYAISQPQINRLLAHPDIGVEQVMIGQARPATGFDMGYEGLMDRGLQGAHPVDVFGLLGQKRVCQAFDLPAVITRRSTPCRAINS